MKKFKIYYYGWYYVPKHIVIGADSKEEALEIFKLLGRQYEKINRIKEIKQ